MKRNKKLLHRLFFLASFLFSSLPIGCAEPGEDGSRGIDCGEFGSAHDGHCHCDDSYAFDGKTCIAIAQITKWCVEEDTAAEHTEIHTACLCEEVASCPCDGTLETFAQNTYCIPAIHDEG